MARLGIWFSISNTCGSVWANGVKQNKETDEEHDEDCVQVGLKLASVKFDRDGEEGREALGMRNCSIDIFNGLELELV